MKLLLSLSFYCLAWSAWAEESKPIAKPKPTTLTFYVAGVECPSCVYSVNYSISQLKSVSDVTAGQFIENYANVTFDPKVVSIHQIAQAVTEAAPLHGVPYQATMKLFIPDYAKEQNSRKVDALFAKWKALVEVETVDRATGEFLIHFQPLKMDAKKAGPQGLTLDELTAALSDPAPKGLGMSFRLAKEDDPM